MAMEQTQRTCKRCGGPQLFARATTNHVLHLLLTIVTVGLWLPVWLLCSLRVGGWRCQTCGGRPAVRVGYTAILLLLFGVAAYVLASVVGHR